MKSLDHSMSHSDIGALLLSQRFSIIICAATPHLIVIAAPVLCTVIVIGERALITEAAASSRTARRDTIALESLLLVAERTKWSS